MKRQADSSSARWDCSRPMFVSVDRSRGRHHAHPPSGRGHGRAGGLSEASASLLVRNGKALGTAHQRSLSATGVTCGAVPGSLRRSRTIDLGASCSRRCARSDGRTDPGDPAAGRSPLPAVAQRAAPQSTTGLACGGSTQGPLNRALIEAIESRVTALPPPIPTITPGSGLLPGHRVWRDAQGR